MTGLIALIGGNEFRPDCEPMDRALLARLAAEPIVVILPTAAAHENPRLAADNDVRYFRRLSARSPDEVLAKLNALLDKVKNGWGIE